jgi:hypothetical protein
MPKNFVAARPFGVFSGGFRVCSRQNVKKRAKDQAFVTIFA